MVFTGEHADFMNKLLALFCRDESEGRHSIHQQFKLWQLEKPRAYEIMILCTFHADNIHPAVLEDLDGAVHAFAPQLDAIGFPIAQNIRSGNGMRVICVLQ